MAFIVEICGIDGVGKTSVCRELAKLFPASRLKCFPDYSTPIGQRIKSMLHADPDQIDLLVLQALHGCNKIEALPALQLPGLLFCDRYITCARVYGAEDGVHWGTTEALLDVLPPASLHVLLKEDPVVCHERVHGRAEDHYGKRGLTRMSNLFQRYMEIAHTGAHPRPDWLVVPMTGKTAYEVAGEIADWVSNMLVKCFHNVEFTSLQGYASFSQKGEGNA